MALTPGKSSGVSAALRIPREAPIHSQSIDSWVVKRLLFVEARRVRGRLLTTRRRLVRLPDRPSNRSGLTQRNAISGKQRNQTTDADSA